MDALAAPGHGTPRTSPSKNATPTESLHRHPHAKRKRGVDGDSSDEHQMSPTAKAQRMANLDADANLHPNGKKSTKTKSARSPPEAVYQKKEKQHKIVDKYENADEFEDDNEVFEVDRLLWKRRDGGHYQYLVRWKGYTQCDDTWEPSTNLLCPEKVKIFERVWRLTPKATRNRMMSFGECDIYSADAIAARKAAKQSTPAPTPATTVTSFRIKTEDDRTGHVGMRTTTPRSGSRGGHASSICSAATPDDVKGSDGRSRSRVVKSEPHSIERTKESSLGCRVGGSGDLGVSVSADRASARSDNRVDEDDNGGHVADARPQQNETAEAILLSMLDVEEISRRRNEAVDEQARLAAQIELLDRALELRRSRDDALHMSTAQRQNQVAGNEQAANNRRKSRLERLHMEAETEKKKEKEKVLALGARRPSVGVVEPLDFNGGGDYGDNGADYDGGDNGANYDGGDNGAASERAVDGVEERTVAADQNDGGLAQRPRRQAAIASLKKSSTPGTAREKRAPPLTSSSSHTGAESRYVGTTRAVAQKELPGEEIALKKGTASHHVTGPRTDLAGKLPYDPSRLVWDEHHVINTADQYCYCGGPRVEGAMELYCSECKNWFHGDHCAFMVDFVLLRYACNYRFTCAMCNKTSPWCESFDWRPAKLSEGILTAMALMGHSKRSVERMDDRAPKYVWSFTANEIAAVLTEIAQPLFGCSTFTATSTFVKSVSIELARAEGRLYHRMVRVDNRVRKNCFALFIDRRAICPQIRM